jgi:cyanate permease
MDDDELILRRRAQATRLAATGQRVGYTLLGIALVVFVFGMVTDLNTTETTIVVVCLAVAALVLGPSIILGYAAKAAEREERTGRTGH